MVVVRCLILCSKFSKNRLSAGLCPDPLGELTALPRPPIWIMGEGRGNGRWKGRRGGKGEERGGKRNGRGMEGYPHPNENPGYNLGLEYSVTTISVVLSVFQKLFNGTNISVVVMSSCLVWSITPPPRTPCFLLVCGRVQ